MLKDTVCSYNVVTQTMQILSEMGGNKLVLISVIVLDILYSYLHCLVK